MFYSQEMIEFLKDEVANGSIIAIALKETTFSTYTFTADDTNFMKTLGAVDDCSVDKIGEQ